MFTLVAVFAFGNTITGALALQQVAGEIKVTVQPGQTSSFQWGLLSDIDQPSTVRLHAEGEGAEFLQFPDSVILEPGKFYWVTVSVTVPADHPGPAEIQPSLFATEQGETGGATVMNIQMQKVVKLTIRPNPDQAPASASLILSDYPQAIAGSDGETIQLLVQSTSEISEFAFDEQRKSITFETSGGDGAGFTIILLGPVLEGPYVVTVDGTGSGYESIGSEEQAQEPIKITHGQGQHSISITGTRVVPEFFSLQLILLGLIFAVLTLGHALKIRPFKA